MRNFIKTTVAGLLLAGSITAGSAADMPIAPPPPPPYDWSGWYLGVGFGGHWGESTHTYAAGPGLAAPIPGGTIGPGFDQPMVSFHGGLLRQFTNLGWGSIVIGIDQSAAMPLDNGIGDGAVVCPNPAFVCGTRLQSLFTTGGIVGLAWDRFLISARGGWAGGSVETRRFVAGTGALFDNTKLWHNGWYFGGGIDWAVYKTAGTSGILGLEYQYVDLGDSVHCPTGCGVAIAGTARNVDVTASVIKAKFTLKFDGPPFLQF